MKKPSVPKCSEGLRKSSGKLEKLFSSFLRGASCPKSPRVAATAAISFMPEPIADVKSTIFGVGTQQVVPLQQTTLALVFCEQLGQGLGLGADEAGRKVLGQERIGLGARDGFERVLVVFILWAGESDERCGEFHLQIIRVKSGAAHDQSLFHHGVAVYT